MGVKKSKERLAQLIIEAKAALKDIGLENTELSNLADYICDRKK